MKKLPVIVMLLLLCIPAAFAWNNLIVDEDLNPTTEGFNISAFKEGASPKFYIEAFSAISPGNNIVYDNENPQQASVSEYDVTAAARASNRDETNASVSNALIIEIGTNLTRSIDMTVTFYPFVKMEGDHQDFIKATYSFTVAAEDKPSISTEYRGTQYTYSSVINRSGSGDIVADTLEGTSVTLTNNISAKNGKGWGVALPSNGGITLLGVGDQLLVSRCRFGIKSINLTSFEQGVTYVSYVSLTVTPI